MIRDWVGLLCLYGEEDTQQQSKLELFTLLFFTLQGCKTSSYVFLLEIPQLTQQGTSVWPLNHTLETPNPSTQPHMSITDPQLSQQSKTHAHTHTRNTTKLQVETRKSAFLSFFFYFLPLDGDKSARLGLFFFLLFCA